MDIVYPGKELDEWIAEEDELLSWQKGKPECDPQPPISTIVFWWCGTKYSVTGSGFVRGLEPYNKELYEILWKLIEEEGHHNDIANYQSVFQVIYFFLIGNPKDFSFDNDWLLEMA
ncbi:MAG: hypothetical protein LBP87_07655 [Planctomycetaceae bacterium]|jgi:hypothetical protein|nr:hypothetical protein [Planctomycetaceae bacterium]